MEPPRPNFYELVYAVARRIPRGKVTTYGRIAHMLDSPRGARAVGYALNALNGRRKDPHFKPVPWQRVINAQGRISIINREATAEQQAELLRNEGVAVSDELTIDLDTYLWEGLSIFELDDILSNRPR